MNGRLIKIFTVLAAIMCISAAICLTADAEETTAADFTAEQTTEPAADTTSYETTAEYTEPAADTTNAALSKIYGDADKNGRVTAADVLIMRKYLAGWQVDIDLDMADIDLSGRVNSADILFMRKFFAGYTIILGDTDPSRLDFSISRPSVKVTAGVDKAEIGWSVSGKHNKVTLYDEQGSILSEFDNSVTKYTISGLISAKKYSYTLIATNDNEYGHFESQAAKIEFVTALCTPITTVSGVSSSEIEIKWNNNSTYDNIKIYYADSGSDNWSFYKTVKAANLSAAVGGLSAGKRYDLKAVAVAAVDGTETQSAPSAVHYGTTKPGNVSGLKASAKSDTSISLSWSRADAAQSYQIYRSTSKSGTYSKIATVSGTGYTDTGLKYNTAYYYKVRSYMTLTPNEYTGAFSSVATAKTSKHIYYQTIKYGTSYQGRALTAYVFNPNATKTLFCDFAVHGFEDDYYRDGQVLVDCAMKVIEYYNDHISELGGWRLVIVPCANPDGTYAGKNDLRACSTAFGRCTADHIDMNRDFKSGAFKAKESRALRDLIKKYSPKYYINFHGWLDTTLGDLTIGSAFRSALGLTGNQDGQYGADKGYIIGWVKNNIGSKACLVEFKSPSGAKYQNVVKGLNKLMK